jgi:hypothetical protein
MTRLRRTALLALLIVPVAAAGLTASGLRDAHDSADTGVSVAAITTQCVGVDYAGIQVSRCVPLPDTLG